MSLTTRSVSWLKPALRDFQSFPVDAQTRVLAALTIAAAGGKAGIAKPLKGFGSGVLEIALKYRGDAFHVVYALQFGPDLIVLHESGLTSKKCRDANVGRLVRSKMGTKLEIVRGSGNVYRDVGRSNADAEQLKALLAAEIIKALDTQKLSVRAAGEKTGFAAADFSRIRQAKLDRFTIDRLMSILGRLDRRVDVSVETRSRRRGGHSGVSLR